MSGAERLRRFKAKRGGAAAYRNSRRDSSPEEYQKYLAWKLVESAIKTGRLKSLPCERCGDPKSQAHHDDYSQPLEVTWLCAKHHRERHRELVAASEPQNPLGVSHPQFHKRDEKMAISLNFKEKAYLVALFGDIPMANRLRLFKYGSLPAQTGPAVIQAGFDFVGHLNDERLLVKKIQNPLFHDTDGGRAGKRRRFVRRPVGAQAATEAR